MKNIEKYKGPCDNLWQMILAAVCDQRVHTWLLLSGVVNQ